MKSRGLAIMQALAHASMSAFVPHFPPLAEDLREVLSMPSDDPDVYTLQVQALDAVGSFALACGHDPFAPYAETFLILIFRGAAVTSPHAECQLMWRLQFSRQTRKTCPCVSLRCLRLLVLPWLLAPIMRSMREKRCPSSSHPPNAKRAWCGQRRSGVSRPGVSWLHPLFILLASVFDVGDEDDEDEDGDDDGEQLPQYLSVRESAVNALGIVAQACFGACLQILKRSVETMQRLAQHFEPSLRKASHTSLCQVLGAAIKFSRDCDQSPTKSVLVLGVPVSFDDSHVAMLASVIFPVRV
jgi:hypothetical protein